MSATIDDWLDGRTPSEEFLGNYMPPQRAHRSGSRQPNWLVVGLLCVIAVLLFSNRGCSLPIPNPVVDGDQVVIDEPGNYVLILKDDSESGQRALSKGQAAAITSTKVAAWCKANGYEIRIKSIEEDFSTMESVWQKLKRAAAKPPSLTVVSDGNAQTGALPDGIEQTISAVESVK